MAQTAFLKTFCNARGMIVEKCIEEYGSGLDYKREAWNGLLEMVMAGQVKTIVITEGIGLYGLAMNGLNSSAIGIKRRSL